MEQSVNIILPYTACTYVHIHPHPHLHILPPQFAFQVGSSLLKVASILVEEVCRTVSYQRHTCSHKYRCMHTCTHTHARMCTHTPKDYMSSSQPVNGVHNSLLNTNWTQHMHHTHSSTCPLLQVIEPLSPLNHLGQVVPHHSLHLHKEGDRSSAWTSIRMGNGQYPNRYGQYPNRYGQTPKGWGAIGIQGNMQVSIVYCRL